MINSVTLSESNVIRAYKVTTEESKWFGISDNAFLLTSGRWFPKEAICGTVNKFFADTNNIGYKFNGNMGSRTVSVIDIEKTKELLESNGYLLIIE